MSDHNEPCGCDESRRLREDLQSAIEKAYREGVVAGENEYARWIDRKGAIILDSGEDEKAVDALQRYRMGRGW